MLFNSVEFLLFFPIVTLIYFAIPHRFRWFHLLLASCIFYSFFVPIYILILFFTIIIDFFAGIWIEQSQGKHKKSALIMSLIANIGVLAIFKYYNFFIDNFNAILFRINPEQLLPYWDIILPIGLSFHTFQAMSYTIEVYRGNQKAERHLGIYALYVMFYPQLVAGPIERPQNVLHQFYEKHEFNYENAKSGLRLMLWGMFKKVVIADRLSVFVNKIYGNPLEYQGLPLIIATLFFSIQIYCDFSGYSDIAIGSARVMGFKLMKNFDRPYFSKTISEFWKRWHISLSTWFRDYLYIPLGGNRVGTSRRYFNLFLVFMVSGLWHGASWHFVIWGALHGIYSVFAIILYNFQKKYLWLEMPSTNFIGFLSKFVHAFVTFVLVAFAWIFFAAHSNADSVYIATHLFNQSSHSFIQIIEMIGVSDLQLIVLSVVLMEFVHWMQRNGLIEQKFNRLAKWQQWLAYYFVFFLILCFGVYNNSQFIYFQF